MTAEVIGALRQVRSDDRVRAGWWLAAAGIVEQFLDGDGGDGGGDRFDHGDEDNSRQHGNLLGQVVGNGMRRRKSHPPN